MPDLYPEEVAAVSGAVEKRRVEYAKGRGAARRALKALGREPGAIPTGRHREPLWPDGIVGSITHCPGLVAVVVAPSAELWGIGIDAEPSTPLPPHLREMVFREGEWEGARTACPIAIDPGKLLFCAKEALFKAVFPITRQYLDFQDVRVTLCPESSELRASLADREKEVVDAVLKSVRGRYGAADGFLMAVCSVVAPV